MSEPIRAPAPAPTPSRVAYRRLRAATGLALSGASQTSEIGKVRV